MKMRKFLCLLLSLLMLVSLAACGDKDKKEDSGKSAKAVAESFMEALIDSDAKAMFDLLPDEVVDAMLEETGMTKSEWKEELDYMSESLAENMADMEDYYGGKIKITYEIADEYDLDDDELEYLQENYEELDIKVKDAKVLEIDATMKAGDYEEDDSMELIVIKVGSNWYLDISSLEDIM